MPSQASATVRALESDLVGRLARFFPDATPVRIPIHLSRAREADNANTHVNGGLNGRSNGRNGNGNGNGGNVPAAKVEWSALQETVIEFGTANEVLFLVAQPLEFADRVLIEGRDGSLRTEAYIVAVQYHPDRTVVAARFLKPVPNWIVKS